MKYIKLNHERTHRCYFEFVIGKRKDWYQSWGDESRYLGEDDLDRTLIYKAFYAANPDFDPYDITFLNKAQWLTVIEYSKTHLSEDAQLIVQELSEWMDEAFEQDDTVSILGI